MVFVKLFHTFSFKYKVLNLSRQYKCSPNHLNNIPLRECCNVERKKFQLKSNETDPVNLLPTWSNLHGANSSQIAVIQLPSTDTSRILLNTLRVNGERTRSRNGILWIVKYRWHSLDCVVMHCVSLGRVVWWASFRNRGEFEAQMDGEKKGCERNGIGKQGVQEGVEYRGWPRFESLLTLLFVLLSAGKQFVNPVVRDRFERFSYGTGRIHVIRIGETAGILSNCTESVTKRKEGWTGCVALVFLVCSIRDRMAKDKYQATQITAFGC